MSGWTFRHSIYAALFLLVALFLTFWNILALQIYLGLTLVIHVLANLEIWLKGKKKNSS